MELVVTIKVVIQGDKEELESLIAEGIVEDEAWLFGDADFFEKTYELRGE